MTAAFDADLLPEACPGCEQRVVKVAGRCPLCATLAEGGQRRPAVAPCCPPRPRAARFERGADGALEATGAGAVARLDRLAARVARLAEVCPHVPPVEAFTRDGDRAALRLAPVDAAPLDASIDATAHAWAVTAALARVEAAARALDLVVTPTRDDVRVDAGGRVWLTGVEGLDDALGQDPRRGAVAWALLVADLLGAPTGPAGVDLEAVSDRHAPTLLAALRAALGGAPPAEALGLPPAPPPDDVRAALAREVLHTVRTDQVRTDQGPLLVARDLGAARGARAYAALDLARDRAVRLEVPDHADADPAAVQARRRAFAGATLTCAPLDPALARARVPALRRGEPARVAPLAPPPPPAAPAPAVAPPPALAAVLKDGAAALRVTGLAPGTPVAVVRARGAGPLLLPEDGDLVAEPVAAPLSADDAVDLTDAEPGERYAAFPLHDGAPLPPGRASTRDEVEVEALEARPQVGAVEVAWRAPAGVVVVVRHGPSPITSPRDGELLAWGRARRALVHDCLDPDQRVFYRAFALGPRGTLSPGLEADAVVLGPPPALGAVRATPGDGRVTLAWSWPDGRSYDRVVVRREPAWPDGERAVPRADDPCLVDAEAPLGHALTYELRAALGPTVGRREARVTSKALAELTGFRALPGGRAVALELSLPAGLPPGASVEVVRNAERPPASMDDGSFVRWPRGADRHVDEPLPAGAPVFYRACLVLDGARSPGLLAQATPLERAGQLSGVEVVPGRASLSLRFVPPAERCDEVRVYAAGAPVACDPALVRQGGPLEVPAPPGVPLAVRLVVVYQGAEDASQAVEVAATAWDDVDALVARPATGGVELAWTPPAAPPRAYRLRRAPRGKPDEAVELTVAPDAAHFLDPDVVARRAYEYSLSCRWGPEDAEVETPPRAVEATAWASPPDLERPDVRSLPGAVQASWLPCAPKDRVHWDGVAVLTSDRAEGEVRAALDGRLFTADDAPGLGLALVEQRPKGRAREALRLPPPPEGQALTYVLASRSGPVHRAVLVTAALGLPEGFLALRPDAAAATPTVAWTLPPWARPTALAITRGLEEAALAGLDPQELEALSQPWRGDLEPTATSFSDPDALPFVSWGYALEATLQVGAHAVVVTGPRAVVPRCQGGRLAPAVEQARGLFGWGAKSKVEVRFALEGGRAATWPPFELKRGVAGQAGARTVWSYPGGPPPPPFTDEDLGNFTRGMTLVYAVELARKRDALGFTTGEARVTLG